MNQYLHRIEDKYIMFLVFWRKSLIFKDYLKRIESLFHYYSKIVIHHGNNSLRWYYIRLDIDRSLLSLMLHISLKHKFVPRISSSSAPINHQFQCIINHPNLKFYFAPPLFIYYMYVGKHWGHNILIHV